MAGLHKRGQVWWASYVKLGKQVKVSLKTKKKREADYKLKDSQNTYIPTLSIVYTENGIGITASIRCI